MVQIFHADASLFQAVSNRLFRKTSRVLVSIEALFFSRSDQPAIADDHGLCVTVVCIYPEYVHSNSMTKHQLRHGTLKRVIKTGPAIKNSTTHDQAIDQ